MGGIEVLPFAVLVFVVGGLLLANAWAVVDAKLAVTAAAREAARAYVEADDATAAAADALAASDATLAGHGRDPRRAGLARTGSFTRCSRVRIAVSYPVPALVLPFLGGVGGIYRVQGAHAEVVDPFRNGVPGVARCG